MTRQGRKLVGLTLMLVGAMALAVTTLSAQQKQAPPKSAPQSTKAHPVEGTYDGSAASTNGPVPFLLIIKREGQKWVGQIQNSPNPIAVSGLTVDKANTVTIKGTVNDAPITITGQYKAGKLEGNWFSSETNKGTWAATKRKS